MALPLRQPHQRIEFGNVGPIPRTAATDGRDLLAQAHLELRRPPHIHGICDVRKFVEADDTVVFIPLCLCDVPGPEFVAGQGEDPADAEARARAWVCNWQDADADIAAYILYIERSTEQRVLRQTERFTDARRRETALNTAVTR
jgi:hypothetical protein